MLTYADLLTYADMLTRRSASIWCPARSPTSFLFIFLFLFLFFPYLFDAGNQNCFCPQSTGAPRARRPPLSFVIFIYFYFYLFILHRCTTRWPISPLFREFYFFIFFIFFAQVRHALADLFLDIDEYNGGTTGLDAYWAGLV
jgi:hypothetical protein